MTRSTAVASERKAVLSEEGRVGGSPARSRGASADEAAGCRVEVIYALPDEQRIIPLEVAAGATAEHAVRASGILDAFPDIAARPLVLGLFGERIELDHVLSTGDRVEICRPLVRDPRILRRELLAQGRGMGVAAKRSG